MAPPATGRFSGYMATCSQNDNVASRDLPPEDTSVIFEGLTERETYRVEIFTLGENGVKSEGAVEVITTVTTQNLPHVGGAKVSPSRDSVTVKWHKPDFDALTGYEVSCFQIGKSDGMDNDTLQSTSGQSEGAAYGGESRSPMQSKISGQSGNEEQIDIKRGINETNGLEVGSVSSQRIGVDHLGDHRVNSAGLEAKKEDNGDSGVSSEADEGKSLSPRKGRTKLRPAAGGQLVFTAIVDAEQTEVCIGRLTSGTDYRVEVTTLCEEQKSEVVVLETKTESKPPPILSTDHRVTEDEISVSWYTPPLDFTGYKAVCYKILPMEARRDGHLSMDQSGEATMTMVNVGEKSLGCEATMVSFCDLEGNTPYVVEIFTVHGSIENEAAEIVVRTARPPKPPQVTDLSWEAEENSFTVSWQKPASEVTGFLVNIVLPTNPSELVISDPLSPKAVGEGEASGGEGRPLVLQRMCRDAETGELVECLVRGEVLDQRRLEADQTSTVFGDLEPGTVYAVHVVSLQGGTESDWVHFVAETLPVTDGLFPVVDLEASCTRDTIQLVWSPPDGSVTGYRIKWSAVTETEGDRTMTGHAYRELPAAQGGGGGVEGVKVGSDRTTADISGDSVLETDKGGGIGKSGQGEIQQTDGNVVDAKDSNKRVGDQREEGSSRSESGDVDSGEGVTAEPGNVGEVDRPKDENLHPRSGGGLPSSEKDGEGIDEMGDEMRNQSRSGVVDVGAEISLYDIQGLAPCTDYLIQVWTLDGDDLSDPVEVTAKTFSTYKVAIHTQEATEVESGPNAYITVHGSRGDTGKRELWRSDHEKKFQPGQVDVFYLQAVDIGFITKVTFGQESTTSGQNWKVGRVVVCDHADPTSQVTFPCDQWISSESGDGLAEKVLEPSSTRGLLETEDEGPTESGELEKGERAEFIVREVDEKGVDGVVENSEKDGEGGKHGGKIEAGGQPEKDDGSRVDGHEEGMDEEADGDKEGDSGGQTKGRLADNEVAEGGKEDGEGGSKDINEGQHVSPVGDDKEGNGSGKDAGVEEKGDELDEAVEGGNGEKVINEEHNSDAEGNYDKDGSDVKEDDDKDVESAVDELGGGSDGGRNEGDRRTGSERTAGNENPRGGEKGAEVKKENDAATKDGLGDQEVANGGEQCCES